MTHLRLYNSNLDLMISPSYGGGIISFEAFGEPVLKPAPVPITGPIEPAAFVLLPYCNRIANGHAEFEDEVLSLTSTLSGEPHALHGEGWISKWEVKACSEISAELSYIHKPTNGTWPWAFEAMQKYELSGNRLVHFLKILNMSERPMPAGLGFHPYFPRQPGDRFAAHVEGKWNVQDDLLPTSHEQGSADDYWPNDQLDPGLLLDHCFTGWNGKLTLSRRGFQVSLKASEELGLLHVYAPLGADFFCAEPVSHMPDALNRPDEADQMQVVQPGETFKASISYLVEKSA